ncbi:hypothetical protein BHM03_00023922 [Ensete ventricosum]|nr:hypothetical protein BHM03_00023922 [Ensete ventricosum]
MGFLKNHWSRWPPRTCTKDLVGMGVPDVTPLTLKSVFDFFLGDRKEGSPYARSTFIVTLGVVELYSESVGVEVWGEGMTCHMALMACAAAVGLAHHPDASTSVADVAADLATELARTRLHLGCRCGCRPSTGLGELGKPIICTIILRPPPGMLQAEGKIPGVGCSGSLLLHKVIAWPVSEESSEVSSLLSQNMTEVGNFDKK